MIEAIDTFTYSILFKMITQINTYIMIGISFLASAKTLISIVIILWLILKNRRYSKYITINLVLVFVLNRIIKYIVRRPRPQVLALVIEKGYSFPSAHAMVSFAFYGFIIYLIMRSKLGKKQKIIYSTLLSIIIFLIGISRIYLGVHYATDVIGGCIIGALYLWLFTKFIYNKKTSQSANAGSSINNVDVAKR